jgi:hypothetical protein
VHARGTCACPRLPVKRIEIGTYLTCSRRGVASKRCVAAIPTASTGPRLDCQGIKKGRISTMRDFEELVPLDQVPDVVPNIAQICEYAGDRPCDAAADVSVWGDFGVTRHRWIESRALCTDHCDLDTLAYYEQALPITQQGRTLLTNTEEPEGPAARGPCE